jgi:protein SCO1/2
MSKKILLFILFTSLALIAISLYLISVIDPGNKPKPTAEITNIIVKDIKITESFNLLDGENKPFTNANLLGKYTMLYFGFTHCPDLCPYTLQKFKESAALLTKEELNEVQFVFVSIDPSRDNDKALQAFVTENGENQVIGVTGDKSELDKLASSLKAYYAKTDDKENYYVDHTSFVYLLDPKAQLMTQFSQGASAEEMATVIKEKMVK